MTKKRNRRSNPRPELAADPSPTPDALAADRIDRPVPPAARTLLDFSLRLASLVSRGPDATRLAAVFAEEFLAARDADPTCYVAPSLKWQAERAGVEYWTARRLAREAAALDTREIFARLEDVARKPAGNAREGGAAP